MKLLFYANADRDPGYQVSKAVAARCEAMGAEVSWIYEKDAQPQGNFDCVVALGGDGTVLTAARMAVNVDAPVIGINLGSVGYLTELERDETDRLDGLLTGAYRIEERMMLRVRQIRNGEVIYQTDVLNDCVICHGDIIHTISLELHVGKSILKRFSGDGLVVSTPTGSTAYSMAAGGPVVDPACEAVVATPICPHSLSDKVFVLGTDKQIRVYPARKEGDVRLCCDGMASLRVLQQDVIEIEKSTVKTRFIRLTDKDNNDFLDRINRKLANN